MAFDIFLKLADVKGDATDARHREEIVVLSWDWGMTQTTAPIGGGGASGGAAAGRTEIRRIQFAHRIDVASPLIMLTCATGKHLREAKFTVRHSGEHGAEFFTVKLSDVIVTLVEPTINGDNGETYEAVALEFAKVEVEYTPRAPNGTPGTPVRFGWDLRANRPIP